MIRLDNRFVYKDKSKYYLTDVTKVSEWRKMSDSEKRECKGKNVTKKVKKYLELYKSSSNINIKTKPSKKRLRTVKKDKKKIVMGGNGGGWPFATGANQTGGWMNKIKGGFNPWNAVTSTSGQKGGWGHTKRE